MNEVKRLYHVLDERLERVDYLAGEYSIADIATFTWTRSPQHYGLEPETDVPNVARWLRAIGERPAVKAGLEVPKVAPRRWMSAHARCSSAQRRSIAARTDPHPLRVARIVRGRQTRFRHVLRRIDVARRMPKSAQSFSRSRT
jgi:hypothetical protein